MKYFMLIVGLLILVFAVVFLRITFLTGKKRQRILDEGLGFDNFELLFLLIKISDWLGQKIHLKYLGNVLSFLIGLILLAGGFLLEFIIGRSFF